MGGLSIFRQQLRIVAALVRRDGGARRVRSERGQIATHHSEAPEAAHRGDLGPAPTSAEVSSLLGSCFWLGARSRARGTCNIRRRPSPCECMHPDQRVNGCRVSASPGSASSVTSSPQPPTPTSQHALPLAHRPIPHRALDQRPRLLRLSQPCCYQDAVGLSGRLWPRRGTPTTTRQARLHPLPPGEAEVRRSRAVRPLRCRRPDV